MVVYTKEVADGGVLSFTTKFLSEYVHVHVRGADVLRRYAVGRMCLVGLAGVGEVRVEVLAPI